VAELSLSSGEKELKELSLTIQAAVPGLEARLVKRVTQSETAVLGKLEMLVYLVTLVVLILTMMSILTFSPLVYFSNQGRANLSSSLYYDLTRPCRI
jgi:putative ABC transport system permease protein